MKRVFFLLFGLFTYLITVFTILYLIGFIGNVLVKKSIDGAPEMPFWSAIGIDVLLILLFALQHSIMARRWFKRLWRKHLPAAIERSVYGLFSCLALFLLMHKWQPLGLTIWHIHSEVFAVIIYSLYFFGWSVMITATFLINHWDLFGVRQVYLRFNHKPYTALNLEKPFLYKRIRHPLYLGLLIAFWATPHMTITHLLFSSFLTMYILIAIKFEERDLIADFGDHYLEYKKEVPMLNPFQKKFQSNKNSQPLSEDLLNGVTYLSIKKQSEKVK